MKNSSNILIIIFFFINTQVQGNINQSSNTQPGLQIPDAIEIYRSAYIVAMQDGKINESEESILKSIERSLNISREDILSIEYVFRLESPEILDQSGRWPLVMQNIVWGGGLYGWAIPYILNAENIKWFIGTEMMSLGGAFYATYQYTKNMEISHAKAQMMRAGSGLGFRYGWGINTLLDLWSDDEDQKLWAWILMGSVPAGIYGGDYLYKKWNPTNGQSWVLTLWGEIGSYTFRQLHNIIDEKPKEPNWVDYRDDNWQVDDEAYNSDYKKWEKEDKKWERKHTFYDLMSYPLSIYLSHKYYGDAPHSFGDALMLYQGRWLGWMYSLIISDIADVDFESSTGRFIRTAGTIGGTLLMDRYIKGYDYTFGQSVLMLMGTSSGMAFSLGISAILEIQEETPLQILVMIGGIAGLYLTNSILNLKQETGNVPSNNQPVISVSPTVYVRQGSNNNPKKLLIPAVSVEIHF